MTMPFKELRRNAQRGSKPRCHLFTDGSPVLVANRLTRLAAPFAIVDPSDQWMPQGFTDTAEAELDKAERLLDSAWRGQLADWWLPADRQGSRTPNFDIASTCTIDGKRGLLLIEAKAHDQELSKEAAGRQLPVDASEDRKASHPSIGQAIEAARAGLTAATGHPWRISRDSHYQMSNRFAWSWKLTQLGIPVCLIYLGFLCADEMVDQGGPILTAEEWNSLVLSHSASLFPPEIWGKAWTMNAVRFVPLISTAMQPLQRVRT